MLFPFPIFHIYACHFGSRVLFQSQTYRGGRKEKYLTLCGGQITLTFTHEIWILRGQTFHLSEYLTSLFTNSPILFTSRHQSAMEFDSSSQFFEDLIPWELDVRYYWHPWNSTNHSITFCSRVPQKNFFWNFVIFFYHSCAILAPHFFLIQRPTKGLRQNCGFTL